MADLHTNTQIHRRSVKQLILFFFLLVSTLSAFSQQRLSSKNKKALKLYEKGQQKAKERDFDSAILLFSKAIASDPGFYEAYLRKGSLFNAMGQEDSVYENFSKYLTLTKFPAPTVLSKAAMMAFRRGEYQTSKGWLEKSIQISPKITGDKEVTLLKSSLDFAIEERKKEAVLTITPLPKAVNKFALQYLPSITIDNSELFYTKRDEISGNEDIVTSKYVDGEWLEATSISPRINTP
ncbi:MAG: hypothetical protein AAGA66_18805 [Bacteroidota bacterium]